MSKFIATEFGFKARLGVGLSLLSLVAISCQAPQGLAKAEPSNVQVLYDFDNLPLPRIPLPNDLATRPDANSATGIRVNASMIAPTAMEGNARAKINELDGWGALQGLAIPFTGEIDLCNIMDRHSNDYDTSDDAVYLVNIQPDSEGYGELVHLDVGNGNYPIVLERTDKYGPNDPRGWTLSLTMEEADEDRNGNGKLDPGEDANRNRKLDPGEDKNGNGVLDPPEDEDADGVLDKPNYLPTCEGGRQTGYIGPQPIDDLAARADAHMTFYERATNTLLLAPMVPLREQNRYAVIVTKRVIDREGDPVGSSFDAINHIAQTDDLKPLLDVLPEGIKLEDIAATWSYTVRTVEQEMIQVREGLYGHGIQGHLGEAYPADLTRLHALKTIDQEDSDGNRIFEPGRLPYVMHHEDWEEALEFVATQIQGGAVGTAATDAVLDAHRYIDFHTMGVITSPQLFPREDADGNPLDLDLQTWPADIHRVPAEHRAEEIDFWLSVPRKESSPARADGKPAPVVILGHGYGGNRVSEFLLLSGFLAQYGLATIAIDSVSHGVAIVPEEAEGGASVFEALGLRTAADVLLGRHRGVDRDGDGLTDSGEDFWTAYLFHTRDVVRQTALDYMQLIRVIRGFDGKRKWKWNTSTSGVNLAGDFDGDGEIDIGGDAPIYMMGGSLGGIMTTVVGGLEPEIDAVIPIAGGGRLTDVGTRSIQGGISEAVIMRAMGQSYMLDVHDDGVTEVRSHAVDGTNIADIVVDRVQGIHVGDTVIVENLDGGDPACAYILADENGDDSVAGRARVYAESDAGDRMAIHVYRGPALVNGSEHCELVEDAKKVTTIDRFAFIWSFRGDVNQPGPLRAPTDGLGLRRAHHDFRSFLGIGQAIFDGADPAVYARHMTLDPITYPNIGDTTHTNALIVTTIGDMNVPANTGMTVGRAAGLIDYLNDDERYGTTPNQVLIDNYVAEAIHLYKRFTFGGDPDAEGVMFDVDNFSNTGMPDGLGDLWGDNIPRLEEPLRLVSTKDAYGNDMGGWSGAIFPYAIPDGQHGFPPPGELLQMHIQQCLDEGGTQEDCDALEGNTYDVGWFMFHTIGRYFSQNAQKNPIDTTCITRDSCPGVPPVPPARGRDELP